MKMFYEYECKDGHVTEKRFKIGEAPKSIMCDCGKVARKLFGKPLIKGGPNFHTPTR